MTSYSSDLAFDFDSAVDPGQNTRLLEDGLVNLDTQPPSMGSYAELLVGDTMVFVVYDNTENATKLPPGSTRVVKEVTVTTVDAHTKAKASPFAPTDEFPDPDDIDAKPDAAMTPGGVSAVFGDAPYERPYGGTTFQVANKGRYLATFSVTVYDPATKEERQFTVDPEMIVGDQGGGVPEDVRRSSGYGS